ncbi:hypothetical protein GCM10009551_023650 [Nocardiopsis tropica]
MDNPVDKLWTTASKLWVTHPFSVDAEADPFPSTPRPTVDKLGKTCGRTCGRGVDNPRGPSVVHKGPDLRTGLHTGPVDKNSQSDLRQ